MGTGTVMGHRPLRVPVSLGLRLAEGRHANALEFLLSSLHLGPSLLNTILGN